MRKKFDIDKFPMLVLGWITLQVIVYFGLIALFVWWVFSGHAATDIGHFIKAIREAMQ